MEWVGTRQGPAIAPAPHGTHAGTGAQQLPRQGIKYKPTEFVLDCERKTSILGSGMNLGLCTTDYGTNHHCQRLATPLPAFHDNATAIILKRMSQKLHCFDIARPLLGDVLHTGSQARDCHILKCFHTPHC